jgi:hypothetical protein
MPRRRLDADQPQILLATCRPERGQDPFFTAGSEWCAASSTTNSGLVEGIAEILRRTQRDQP